MKINAYTQKLLLVLLVVAIAFVAACGSVATEEPAPVIEPTETAAQEAEPTEEAASEQEVAQAVEESSFSRQVNLGATVVSDEEVDSPRDPALFGGEYRDVSTSDAVSFHPYLTSDSASSGYQGMVWSGALLRLDENTLEYIPNMAESYSIAEDGLTFTFNLRDTLKWSDGEPITAYDYKWTFDQVTNPENEFPYLSQLEFISSYEALDEHTIQIKIDEIYAPALGQMAGWIDPLPKHIWENLDWSDPETNPEIMHPTVVSGPYKLVEWKRDEYVIFEANENYWYHGAPNMERYVQEIVPNYDIAYEKMKTGETDTAIITPENLEEARQLDNINVYEWWSVSASSTFISLNMRENSPTHDVHVRRGLNYAIDKQLLTDEVMLGQAKRVCSIYPETSWAHNPDVPCYEYDPDKAIEEFAQAGYTFENNQMLDENGEQLKLKLLYGPHTNEIRELIAVTVQDYLADIGIEMEIEALEWASFLDAARATEPDWDMLILSTNSTPDPHTSFPWWSEDNIPQLNMGAYINKEVEQLFDEGAATYDFEVRKQKYGEIQKILADDAVRIFLFFNKSWSGQNKRIQGIEPTRLGIGWNTEDWYIEEAEAQ